MNTPSSPTPRRHLLGLGLAGLATLAAPARAAGRHDHAGHAGQGEGSSREPAAAGRYRSLVKPYQSCTSAIATCIAHCQVLLAEGDKSVGDCLRTALDCDVTCGATLKAAGLNSDYTPALARTAVQSMQVCIEACKPHLEHHAECKACHDACVAAVRASRRV